MLKLIGTWMMKNRWSAKIYLRIRKSFYGYIDRKTTKQYVAAREMATKAINERIKWELRPMPNDEATGHSTYAVGRYDTRTPRYDRDERY